MNEATRIYLLLSSKIESKQLDHINIQQAFEKELEGKTEQEKKEIRNFSHKDGTTELNFIDLSISAGSNALLKDILRSGTRLSTAELNSILHGNEINKDIRYNLFKTSINHIINLATVEGINSRGDLIQLVGAIERYTYISTPPTQDSFFSILQNNGEIDKFRKNIAPYLQIPLKEFFEKLEAYGVDLSDDEVFDHKTGEIIVAENKTKTDWKEIINSLERGREQNYLSAAEENNSDKENEILSPLLPKDKIGTQPSQNKHSIFTGEDTKKSLAPRKNNNEMIKTTTQPSWFNEIAEKFGFGPNSKKER